MAAKRELRRGRAWEVIEYHYLARNAFQAVFRRYERNVKQLVQERGVPREELRLSPDETTKLFDTRELENLISHCVEPLRAASHALFREEDTAEPYDSRVSRIYHELSILKEEHLSVRDFPRKASRREFARLFTEVSQYYPQRLRRVRDLFQRAQKRHDELLPEFRSDAIVLRSAFLFREELWPEGARDGLVRFLSNMFPEKGPVYGFLAVARSFFKAAFHDEAAECARLGTAAAGKGVQARSTRAQKLRDLVSELDQLAARADAERKALQELDR